MCSHKTYGKILFGIQEMRRARRSAEYNKPTLVIAIRKPIKSEAPVTVSMYILTTVDIS